MSLIGHHIRIDFGDHPQAELICPDGGSCPVDHRVPEEGCWLKSWFDAGMGDEVVRGTVALPVVRVEWVNDEHPLVHVGEPALSPVRQEAPDGR